MFLLALLAAAPLHFHVDATEYVNAVYHVGCLTDRIACSKAVYSKFWNSTLKLTSQDSAKLEAFKTVFSTVEGSSTKIETAPFLPNYSSHFPIFRERGRLLAALLGSKSSKEARRRAAAVVSPKQADTLADVLAHFERRLHPWWASTGRAIAQQKVKGVERQMNALGVPKLSAEAAAFLEVQDGARDLYLHVVPSPEYDGKEASANPTLNHFCLEITKDFNVEAMASIALHELTHALYELVPDARKLELMKQFVDSADPSSQPFYMYLNEALATGIQLLLLERNGKKEDDPYHEPFIPRLGQAVLPLIRQAIQAKHTLYEGFATSYIEAGRKAIGAEADGSRFRFSCTAILGDRTLRDLFLEQFPIRFFVTEESERALFPNMNGLHLLTYPEAGSLLKEIPDIEEMMRGRGFGFLKRHDKALELFVLGRDNAAVGELAKKLALRQGPLMDGIIVSLD